MQRESGKSDKGKTPLQTILMINRLHVHITIE